MRIDYFHINIGNIKSVVTDIFLTFYFLGYLLVKLSDYRESLTKELKMKLDKIFDENDNEWVNQFNCLQQMNPTEFMNLKDFSERIYTCKYNGKFKRLKRVVDYFSFYIFHLITYYQSSSFH